MKLHKHQILYQYQIDRIDSNVEVIFVGDSSVGNAINEEVFERETGLNTQNLALTGSYGFGAALNMIRTAIEIKGAKPDVIYIGASPKQFERPPLHNAYDLTNPDAGWFQKLTGYFNLETVKNTLKNFGKKVELEIVNHYMPQDKKISEEVFDQARVAFVKPEKMYYIEQIFDYCKTRNLNCAYFHAPTAASICEHSDQEIEKIDALLPYSAYPPLCIPYSEIGDQHSHVTQDYKDLYTRELARILLNP